MSQTQAGYIVKRKPEFYRVQIEQVLEQAEAHAEAGSQKRYTDRAEFQRALAISIELSQKYADLLGEISEGLDNEEIEL